MYEYQDADDCSGRAEVANEVLLISEVRWETAISGVFVDGSVSATSTRLKLPRPLASNSKRESLFRT